MENDLRAEPVEASEEPASELGPPINLDEHRPAPRPPTRSSAGPAPVRDEPGGLRSRYGISRPTHEDETRRWITVALLLIFGFTVAGGFVAAFLPTPGSTGPTVKDLIQLFLPAETALLGSAMGFYFGSKKNS